MHGTHDMKKLFTRLVLTNDKRRNIASVGLMGLPKNSYAPMVFRHSMTTDKSLWSSTIMALTRMALTRKRAFSTIFSRGMSALYV